MLAARLIESCRLLCHRTSPGCGITMSQTGNELQVWNKTLQSSSRLWLCSTGKMRLILDDTGATTNSRRRLVHEKGNVSKSLQFTCIASHICLLNLCFMSSKSFDHDAKSRDISVSSRQRGHLESSDLSTCRVAHSPSSMLVCVLPRLPTLSVNDLEVPLLDDFAEL